MDTVLMGTDPYLMDLVCARLAGFDYRKVRTLALAEKKGLLTPLHHRYVDSLKLGEIQKKFAPPKAGPLAAFIHSPKRQNFFLKIRNTPFFTYLASTDWFGKLLFLTGLRQDVFLPHEMACNGLSLEESTCNQCGVCRDVCPIGLEMPQYLKKIDGRCIHCLYCYSSCPRQAIKFSGEFGFFEEQLRQYDHLIRALYQ
jgi:ferredoxin